MNAAPKSPERPTRYSEQEVREFAAQVSMAKPQRSVSDTVKTLRSPGKRKPKLLRA